jgi:hypothetical protein
MISAKINVSRLISQHLSSLKSHKGEGISYVDLATFYGLPLILSVLYFFSIGSLKEGSVSQIDSVLIAAFSIFAALLLNAQVLIISLDKKLNRASASLGAGEASPEDSALRQVVSNSSRKEIAELFANVSYSILIAISLVAFTLIVIFGEISASVLVKSVQFFGVTHFCLTGLMVLKRMHVVFAQN